jgi:uncharacterized protein YkwD
VKLPHAATFSALGTILIGAFAAVGCGPAAGEIGADGPPGASVQSAAGDDASTPRAGESSSPGGAEDPCALPERPTRHEEVCRRWSCSRERARTAKSAWGGSPLTCAAGAMDSETRARALESLNTYRFMADLPPVLAELSWEGAAQACALVTHANGYLTHTPPSSSPCWTDLGFRGAKSSLIANRAAPIAVGAFISDPGNESTMGHRRWLLAENLDRVGFGSTDRFSCVLVDPTALGVKKPEPPVVGGDTTETAGGGAREWVAWPPAGPVPFEEIADDKLDATGWTVQSSTQNLAGAKVEVTVDGETKPVNVTVLAPGWGSLSALSFIPSGWKTEAGHRYDVHVTRAKVAATAKVAAVEAVDIDFSVEPIACP